MRQYPIVLVLLVFVLIILSPEQDRASAVGAAHGPPAVPDVHCVVHGEYEYLDVRGPSPRPAFPMESESSHGSYRFGAGSVGPAFFGLGIRDSAVIIVVVDLMCVMFHKFSPEGLTDFFGGMLACRSCAIPAFL